MEMGTDEIAQNSTLQPLPWVSDLLAVDAAASKIPNGNRMSLVLVSLLATRSWGIDAMLHQ
jgi:hypothetical protein